MNYLNRTFSVLGPLLMVCGAIGFVMAMNSPPPTTPNQKQVQNPSPNPTTPSQISGGDKPFELGELIDLSVSFNPTIPNAVAFATDWSVYDLETRTERKYKSYQDDGGKTQGIVFGAGIQARQVLVHASVTYLLVTKVKDKLTEAGTKTELLKVKLVIGTNPPPPDNPHNPNVPDIKFPNEKLGLSSKVYKAVMERGPPATRVVGAKVLATSFRGVQSAIVAGALKDPLDILKKSTAANSSAIATAGLKRDEWLPVFQVIQDELFALYEGNKVSTADQFGIALLEIADAFDAVR